MQQTYTNTNMFHLNVSEGNAGSKRFKKGTCNLSSEIKATDK